MKHSSNLIYAIILPVALAAGPVRASPIGLPDLLVASAASDEVLRYDGDTGAFVGVFASGGGLWVPEGLLFTPEPTTGMLVFVAAILALSRRKRVPR